MHREVTKSSIDPSSFPFLVIFAAPILIRSSPKRVPSVGPIVIAHNGDPARALPLRHVDASPLLEHEWNHTG